MERTMTKCIIFSLLAGSASLLAEATPIASSRIVGGDQAAVGDYPYYVQMGGCGGALIAKDIVLFAAHCGPWEGIQISISAYNQYSLSNGAQSRFCEEWIPDPLYDAYTYDSDFALCKLDEPVVIDDTVVVLELNEADSVPTNGENLRAMGLGTTSYGGSLSNVLLNVTVPTISNSVCNSPRMYDGMITDKMLCAGFADGGYDSCQGDSGGPIVRRIENEDGTKVDTHVGVVSWGFGCASPNKPGVYARTSSRLDWIKETMCNDLNSVAPFCNNEPPPTIKNCGINEEELLVQLTTGDEGRGTFWTIRGGFDQIASRKYMFSNYENVHKFCLKTNHCFTFQITDAYGNGMCDNSGEKCGSYSLSLNDEEFLDGGGDFYYSKQKNFCTGDRTPIEPQSSCKAGLVEYEVDLKTDNFGYETSISTYFFNEDYSTIDGFVFQQQGFTSNVLHNIPPNDQKFCLENNRCYYFEILDSYGDGLYFDGVAGYYEGILNQKFKVVQGEGDFGFMATKIFCTGNVCKDNKKFKITKRKLNCSRFLKGNARTLKSRCKKKYRKKFVYEWCPKSCGTKARLGSCSWMKGAEKRLRNRAIKSRNNNAGIPGIFASDAVGKKYKGK